MDAKLKRMEEKLEFLNRMVLDARKELFELKGKVKENKMSFWPSKESKRKLEEEII